MFICFFVLLIICQYTDAGHSKEEWKSRTIYQILTDRFARTDGSTQPCSDLKKYCGGTWKGITNNLDYIQGMGFDAIWISPIVDNTPSGYHGYWTRDWTAVNSFFGDKESLKELITECHKRDIWVMLDVVANHVGPVNVDYSTIKPFNSPSHYHDYCSIEQADFDNNQWRVENCRLCNLPDLDQDNPFVREFLLKWVKDIVKVYQIDGLRVDTVVEVPKDFWVEYSRSAGVYTLGEIFNGKVEYVKGYIGPLDSVLNYPQFFSLRNSFRRGWFTELWNSYNYLEASFGKELDYMAVFLNNHDNPRLRKYVSEGVNKAAMAFPLLARGIPIFYYGDEQDFNGENDPLNREPLWVKMDTKSKGYQFVKKLVNFRKEMKLWEVEYKQIVYDTNVYVVKRGNAIIVFSNIETPFTRSIESIPFMDGTKLCNYLEPTDCVMVLMKQIQLSFKYGEMVKLYVRVNEGIQSHNFIMSSIH